MLVEQTISKRLIGNLRIQTAAAHLKQCLNALSLQAGESVKWLRSLAAASRVGARRQKKQADNFFIQQATDFLLGPVD